MQDHPGRTFSNHQQPSSNHSVPRKERKVPGSGGDKRTNAIPGHILSAQPLVDRNGGGFQHQNSNPTGQSRFPHQKPQQQPNGSHVQNNYGGSIANSAPTGPIRRFGSNEPPASSRLAPQHRPVAGAGAALTEVKIEMPDTPYAGFGRRTTSRESFGVGGGMGGITSRQQQNWQQQAPTPTMTPYRGQQQSPPMPPKRAPNFDDEGIFAMDETLGWGSGVDNGVGNGNLRKGGFADQIPPAAEYGYEEDDGVLSQSQSQPELLLPGPAGCLPPLHDHTRAVSMKRPAPMESSSTGGSLSRSSSSSSSSLSPNKRPRTSSSLSSSAKRSAEAKFGKPWERMLQTLPDYNETTRIASIALAKLEEKVERLVVLVKDLKQSDVDASLTLKDPTGEIRAIMHQKVFDDFPDSIVMGAVLELKEVSMFRPTPRSLYLNVTSSNIMSIFPANGGPIIQSKEKGKQKMEVPYPIHQSSGPRGGGVDGSTSSSWGPPASRGAVGTTPGGDPGGQQRSRFVFSNRPFQKVANGAGTPGTLSPSSSSMSTGSSSSFHRSITPPNARSDTYRQQTTGSSSNRAASSSSSSYPAYDRPQHTHSPHGSASHTTNKPAFSSHTTINNPSSNRNLATPSSRQSSMPPPTSNRPPSASGRPTSSNGTTKPNQDKPFMTRAINGVQHGDYGQARTTPQPVRSNSSSSINSAGGSRTGRPSPSGSGSGMMGGPSNAGFRQQQHRHEHPQRNHSPQVTAASSSSYSSSSSLQANPNPQPQRSFSGANGGVSSLSSSRTMEGGASGGGSDVTGGSGVVSTARSELDELEMLVTTMPDLFDDCDDF
ncbi:hypothetical protein HK102_010167 [Quaeritorhiza haematococci]|nr:hypothetical protein HK102_010167 [Quaeritorhiza haematococci]